ncbi:hypothetical protein FNV43_RR09369 [Rhamnella rubrinervis]|uniref:ABC-type xenobiotic transporter n=1 Tax=Rhamnella rubrinervis TaxID=2594499 RepID=A0A8K0MJR7_9ROSA|nr:hypothetical protein FNV43_RR09369 [Rhamnella rubrinervis]
MTSAILNGGLGLAYLGFSIWKIYEKLNIENTICPLHGWLVLVFQGFTWLLLGCFLGLQKLHFSTGTAVKLYSIIIFLFGGFVSLASLFGAIVNQVDLIKAVLDILCLPGATLSLISALQEHSHKKCDNDLSDYSFYAPLKDGEASPTSDNYSHDNVTPFAKAEFLSRISFWWLNPLMKLGKGKILQNNDFPRLRQEDQAQTWYSKYEELSKRRQEMHESPSVLSVIFSCQKKPILVSGFLQLVKVLALSTGPLFLKALIDVTEDKAAFRYEGYALAGGLFLAKCLESLSDRQLCFRTRLVGLQVRSLLSAVIYQKQLRLSNVARITHSPSDIMNYVTLDAFRMSEFPYWFHMMWAIPLQLSLALFIVYDSVGLGTVACLVSLILSMLASTPLTKFQLKYQSKLVMAQDKRLKAMTEALANMKVLKLYAWGRHFQNVIETLRKEEAKWASKVLTQKGFNISLFWSSSIVASAATFLTCYFLGIPLSATDIFTFLATLRIVQEPLRLVSDVAGAYIEAKVSLNRITKFLDAPELQPRHTRQKSDSIDPEQAISIMATEVSWQDNSEKATLRNVNFVVSPGEKVAICGEVGSGKSTLLAAILGEVPNVKGLVHVNGKVAYVSQTAWIQTGTIQDNILFGSPMDPQRYQEVLRKSSLVKDLEMFPMGDNTEIGERGVNLSGGQKQRVQLARALYKDADVYLLDDPFSAVDAHTATSLFNEYVMGALSGKTVMLVTHQVDFLPAFDSILFVSDGILFKASSYEELLASSKEFQNLVNSQNEAIDSKKHTQHASSQRSNKVLGKEVQNYDGEQFLAASGDQLIEQEERETGDVGLKPYVQYFKHDKGFLYFSLATMAHAAFVVGQYLQNYLLAADIRNGFVGRINLITTYLLIGCILPLFLLLRSSPLVFLSYQASQSIFPTLLSSLFRAPMSFYDSTPLGRILTRVSSDMSTIDLEVAFKSNIAVGTSIVVYFSYVVFAILSWPVLFVIIPMIYITSLLKRYYHASAKEMMRINGTTKSLVANHLAESIAGAMIIRAFGEEERFFMNNLEVIDMDASPYFHTISANEWLIQRLELPCAIVVSFSVLALTWLPLGASSSGFVGLTLSYGLSLSAFLVSSVQVTCMAENIIVSMERLEQYMHIPSEAAEVIPGHQPPHNWPLVGRVEICDLKIRYRPNAPLVLQGISCIFEGGHKIGIVGRTGSGKTTLVSALFRLVEPAEGRIIVDGIDISTIGLHDLRANLGIIPQDPTLFSGSVRYNLDPLSQYTDQEIWEVLVKCQLRRAVEEKEDGLDSSVVQDGSNWSMGQRQLFCLGRALLKRSKVLVLDEATASIDSATDSILQKTIRNEFGDCTVITVAHRIPTVIDCNMVLAISDGKLMEYDEPVKLMSRESSLFGQLVKEYWSRAANGNAYSEDLH